MDKIEEKAPTLLTSPFQTLKIFVQVVFGGFLRYASKNAKLFLLLSVFALTYYSMHFLTISGKLELIET